MPNRALSLASLPQLIGGRLAKAFDLEIRRAIEDCRDRPTEGRARKVVLQFEAKPETADAGDMETVNVKFQLKPVFPAKATPEMSMQVHKNNQVFFHDAEEAEEPAAASPAIAPPPKPR